MKTISFFDPPGIRLSEGSTKKARPFSPALLKP